MAKLTIVSPFAPYPPHAGGTAHIFHASRHLSRFFDVSLYALARDPHSVTWGPMGEWCQELRAFAPLFRRSVGFDPPAVRQDYSPDLTAFLRSRWRDVRPDIVQLEFTTMAQYAPLARSLGALTVCTAHNVAFLAQLRRMRQEREILLRARRLVGALSLWQYEVRALRQCNLVVTLGRADAQALRRWLPGVPVMYIPSGVDFDRWPICFDAAAADSVLFVGNYAHPPNVEGARWLAREVWPRVRQVHPNAQLTLAGRSPSADVQALAAYDIHIPGTVDDLRPLYARASLVVAPIFWGSGMRIKLLEALACGLPVVTTQLAAEGIPLKDGESALFAETPETFASAISQLLADAQLRAHIGSNGRVLVEREYNWASIARRLVGLYEGARAGRT